MNKLSKLLLLLITSLFFLVGCGTQTINQNITLSNLDNSSKINSYKLIELIDVNTNSTYKLSDFEDKIVLIESFAIWCPSCTAQQREFKKLHKLQPQVISIALDTDQNEEESEVLAHAQTNGFDWRYSISPEELTSYFISNYGIGFVSAPSVPVLLKCPNSEPVSLKRGFKSVDYLIEQINTCNTK